MQARTEIALNALLTLGGSSRQRTRHDARRESMNRLMVAHGSPT
jgi:hypothetical protein